MTNKPSLWEMIEAIPEEAFLNHPLVSQILADLPTKEDVKKDCENIFKGTGKKEERVWLAHENLWGYWSHADTKPLRLQLRHENFLMYKKLTKRFCDISNEYPRTVRKKGDIEKFKEAHNIKLTELRLAHADIGDKVLPKKEK